MANGLIVSMGAFVIGGSFLSLAVNDLTWLTFGLVAALDRFAKRAVEVPEDVPAELPTAPLLLSVPTLSRGR